MLKDKGLILWHDYDYKVLGGGVTRAIDELSRQGLIYHVRQIKGTHLGVFIKRGAV
jgi:hypothetical protein